MSTIKTVRIESRMGADFTMESKIRDHVLHIDQPKANGGTDTGPTPLEYLLLSLAGCIGAIARIAAHQQKLELRSMDVAVEGTLDVDMLLGKESGSRTGFDGITVTVNMDADMTTEQKEAFLHEVDRRCPVSENLANGTPIEIELAG